MWLLVLEIILVAFAEASDTVANLGGECGETAESICDDQPGREPKHGTGGEEEQSTRLRVVVPITQRRHYHTPVAEDVGLR